jgi:sarcosine oxidase subunit delta
MLIIECPHCGKRAETEFSFGGEGGIARPLETETLTDEQWGDYVFMRKNPKGLHHEQWNHAAGCRRWFNALRDTVSYRIVAVWKVGEAPPPEAQAWMDKQAQGVQA